MVLIRITWTKWISTGKFWLRQCKIWNMRFDLNREFKGKAGTLVSSETPSPSAPKSITLKTPPCKLAGGDWDGGWWPFPQLGADGLGLEFLLPLVGLGIGLTGAFGLGLGWYGFWYPLPAPGLGVELMGGLGLGQLPPDCRWELPFFPLPFFLNRVELGEFLGLQCLPLLASQTSMAEQKASKTRRSSRLRPFAVSFIFFSVSTCCVEIRVCMPWEVDRELKSEACEEGKRGV
jgi:hypothetical protein